VSILHSAAQVLRCFSDDCADLSMTELVNRLGLPKSNASRLLRAMRDAGLLETVGETKRYRPGLMLLDVGRAYRRSSTLIARADEVVATLSASSGHTGYVSKRVGLDVTAVTDHAGTNPLRVGSSVGRKIPAFASATGRALLARLTDAEVVGLYGRSLPSVPGQRVPRSMADLLGRLAEVRKTGIATSEDESFKGVFAVATAVGEGDGADADAVSLCIVFPSATSSKSERRSISESLRKGTIDVARIVGDPHVVEPRRRTKVRAA
jgi:DNA-binding IclR family transcriptional regulator